MRILSAEYLLTLDKKTMEELLKRAITKCCVPISGLSEDMTPFATFGAIVIDDDIGVKE